MNTFENHFDDLDFMDCSYGQMTVSHDLASIEVTGGLLIENSHPAYSQFGNAPPPAVLVFRRLSKWHKVSHPYAKTPKDAEFDEKVVELLEWPTKKTSGVQQIFSIEGIQKISPAAWVDIDITAESFELHFPD